MRAILVGAVLAITLAGCPEDDGAVDGSVRPPDARLDDLGIDTDGGGAARSVFSIVGCASLDLSTASPECTGPAPLRLTFVPLSTGVTTFVWTFAGGDPPSSRAITPSVLFSRPGTYAVTLAAGGPAGTSTATGTVIVTSGGVGSPCRDDGDCSAADGLKCVCGHDESGCPGGLSVGVCSRDCDGVVCEANEVCVDLSRGMTAPMTLADGGVGDGGMWMSWRRALCMPACSTGDDCRVGLACREVPALIGGATAGSPYQWRRACFAEALGDIGDACAAPSGFPDPAACLSGRCDPFGARGLCTADCGGVTCPPSAACVSFNGLPSQKLCLRRCADATQCRDPLLACETPGAMGTFGFSSDGDAKVCAPKRCTLSADCAPAGECKPLNGGSFCVRLD